ncbi:EamA family transporter [Rathayibacter soli]|uniref:EamA family transporter n=1 Tax=Rathayibacter soli TaxID=3144168 RepID=UPI0027E49ED6|nr:EamA family transporter [Glaciibacter superstes]
MTTENREVAERTRASTLILALASAAAFGTSGAFVKPLLEAGWSPAAAVAVRAGGGGLVLLIPALIALHGRYRLLLARWKLIVAYGIIAVVGTQVLYFAAIERLPVGIALLIEYSAPILLVLLAWARTRIPPTVLVIAGAVLSIVGLLLVINPSGAGGLDVLGVVFALGAAVCVAGYFLLSALPTDPLPPVVVVCSGLLVGAIALTVVGSARLLPFTFAFTPVTLLGHAGVSWLIPMGVVVIVSTAFAYLAGILAAGKLGSRVASFVGLLEVLFAILFAWWVLGEVPTLLQAAGGALIVGGIVLVKMERPGKPAKLDAAELPA